MNIRKILSNKIVILITTILFGIWITFFDKNNVVDMRTLDDKIEHLEIERDFYKSKIKEDSAVIVGLQDSAYIEAFARENFFMMRPGEQMYIVK